MLDAYLKARYDKQSVVTNAAYHTHFSLSVLAANTYVWPSPKLDTLESLRFNQDGHNSGAITVFIEPCGQYLFDRPNVLTSQTRRSDVADVENWYYVSKLGELTDQPQGCTYVM
jgi:hypothetical protein